MTPRQAALSALTLLCLVGAQPDAAHAQQSGWADPPEQAAGGVGEGWRNCAREGEVCQVAGRTVVRYGVPGRWATRSVNGSVMCSNDAFGDPAPGTPKRCELPTAMSAPHSPGDVSSVINPFLTETLQ